MKAHCITPVDVLKSAEPVAEVILTPGRFGRLFGAKPTKVVLVYKRQYGENHWFGVGSGLELQYLPYGTLIQRALDFRPVSELPRAAVTS